LRLQMGGKGEKSGLHDFDCRNVRWSELWPKRAWEMKGDLATRNCGTGAYHMRVLATNLGEAVDFAA